MENKTVVITSIYSEFYGTREFRKSVERTGLPLYNAFPGGIFKGNGDVIANIYKALLTVQREGFESAIYSDGADSYFIGVPEVPKNYILYSTEKAVWPNAPDLEKLWELYHLWYNIKGSEDSPWKYLNGGGYCGRIPLLIEYFEKYGLTELKGDINGQREQSEAYINSVKDNFPISLDVNCNIFQTTGFEHPRDFSIITDRVEDGWPEKWPKLKNSKAYIHNNLTNTNPSIFHGNGRSDMSWLYNLYK